MFGQRKRKGGGNKPWWGNSDPKLGHIQTQSRSNVDIWWTPPKESQAAEAKRGKRQRI